MGLLEKRKAIIAEHEAMQKYHPQWKAEADAGRKISERPIAFGCDDEVRVIGPCVAKIVSGLEKFLAGTDLSPAERDTRASREPAFAMAVARARKVVAGKTDTIIVSSQVWNSLLLALSEAGVDVVMTDDSE